MYSNYFLITISNPMISPYMLVVAAIKSYHVGMILTATVWFP